MARQGGLREFLPVQLEIQESTVKRGLAQNTFAPTLLKEWVDKLAVVNNAAIL